MELAFVLLFVLLGTGAIVYAGMRRPAGKAETSADGAPVADDNADDADGSDGGSGGD
jgi:hypothetical protein